MLHSVAKVAAALKVDRVTNSLVERWYSNKRTRSSHFARRFQILGYHKVSSEEHPFFPPVTPEIFDQQMKFLNNCYQVMSLQDLVARTLRGDIPERAVAITFDDGYRDNYDHAFPILKKYKFPATIFVATGAIGTSDLIWHDRVFDAFRFATVDRARLADAAVPELIFETAESRERSLRATILRARKLHGAGRQEFIDDIESKLRPNLIGSVRQQMLTWDQIREMHDAGIEFGSHTVSHTIMSNVPESQMIEELRDSKDVLSQQLGTPISSFAYPNGQYGDYNNQVKVALRNCGYSYAVTCCSGFNHASSDLFELKRSLPWDNEIELFRLKFFLQRHGLAS